MAKILIIEDETEVRSLLARRLNSHHFETLEAGDADTGLLQAKEGKPDLVILDLQLPGQDGLQIYRSLRKEETMKQVPVLFLTAISTGVGSLTKEGLGLIASAKHGFKLTGDFEVMTKPYDAKRLIDTLKGMLPPDA